MQRLTEYKKYFLYAMIGSLIAGALVGIVSILVGSFSDTSGKVVLSLVLLMAHAIFSFTIIPDNNNKKRLERLSVFYEVLFILVALSLLTSIFATWSLLEGDIIMQLYLSYLSVGVAALIVSVLNLFRNKSKQLDAASSVGIVSTSFLLLLVLVLIYGYESIDDFFFRLAAVLAIIASTSTVITATLYKLYLQKHPEEKNILFDGKGRSSILRFIGTIVLVYFAINLIFGLIYLISI